MTPPLALFDCEEIRIMLVESPYINHRVVLIDHRRWKKENNFIVGSPTYLMENERKSPGGKKLIGMQGTLSVRMFMHLLKSWSPSLLPLSFSQSLPSLASPFCPTWPILMSFRSDDICLEGVW